MENSSIISQIGNTPLIRLKQASELTGCNIYGKAEYFNPGESVKDRAALFIVEDAMRRKLISKGGTIVEGTAGNTGIGLAIVRKQYDIKLKIVIPNTQSIEKKETLKKLGAELIEVDAVPYSNPKNYIKKCDKVITPYSGNSFKNFIEVFKYKELFFRFIKRDFSIFYKQTILGPLWYIIQPLVYTILFTIIFGNFAKIPTDGLPPFIFY